MLQHLGQYEPFGEKCMSARSHVGQESQKNSIIDFSTLSFDSSKTASITLSTFHHLFSMSDSSTINIDTPLDERKTNCTGKLENPAMELEQEVYVKGSVVVWSRAGCILKTFDYSAEDQLIKDVLFAWFPVNSITDPTNKPAVDIDPHDLEGDSRIVNGYWEKKGPQSIINFKTSGSVSDDMISTEDGDQLQRRTLCIVFEDCIKIHCEDGLSITSQIPFEIGNVVPLDIGVLVSRKHVLSSTRLRPRRAGGRGREVSASPGLGGSRSNYTNHHYQPSNPSEVSSFFVTVTHPLRGVCPVKSKKLSHSDISTLPEQFTSPQKLLFATTKTSETGRLPVIVTLNIKEGKHYIWTYDRRKERKQLPRMAPNPMLGKSKLPSSIARRVSKSIPSTPNRNKKIKLNADDSPHAQFHEDYISDDEIFHENEVDRNVYHELLDPGEITLRLLWRESHGSKTPSRLKAVKDICSKSFLVHDLNGQELICILNNTSGSLQVINLSKASQLLSNCIEFKAPAKSAIPINASRDNYNDLLFMDHTGSIELLIDKCARLPIQTKENAHSLIDPVYDKFSVLLNDRTIFRYQLNFRPKSSLVRDSLAAINCATITFYFPKIWYRFLKLSHLTPLDDNDRTHISEWETFFVSLFSFLNIKKHGYYTGTKKPTSSTAAIKEIQLQQIRASNKEYITNKLGFPNASPIMHYEHLLDENYIQGIPIRWIERVIKFRPDEHMDERIHMDAYEFMEIIKSLHVVYEDYRIKKSMKIHANLLGYLLLQASVILGNKDWIQYYESHGLNPLFTGNLKFTDQDVRPFFIEPPNIQVCLHQMTPNASSNPTLLSSFGVNTLDPSLGLCRNNYAQTIKNIWSLYSAINTGDKSALLDRMVADRITRKDIEILIDPISHPILQVLNQLKLNPKLNWPKEAYTVIERNDMYKQLQLNPTVCDPNTETFKLPFLKDSDHPQSSNDIIKSCTTEPTNPCIYETDILNMETERLRFGFGGFIEKVRMMLDGARVPEFYIPEKPDLPDEDVAAEHQSRVILLIQRTLALGVGRALYAYQTHIPDLTKVLPIEPLILSAKVLPLRTVVTIEESMWSKEFLYWPKFHNGVAAGLRISPSNNVNDSWIDFCYPRELEPQHGGLLLAMGLNGTLKKLSLVDWYRFMTQSCELVPVGFLLGVATAFRGTMDVKVTKLLSVHIPALLPVGSHKFNHSSALQSSSLLGMGLVYMNSCHRLMAMTMLGEIGRNAYQTSTPLTLKPDYEGCALAAGFSFGLITLGAGDEAARMDPQLRNKLYSLMTGRSLVSFNGSHLNPEVPSGNINLDVTSAGATIALGLMYLKTENIRAAESIDLLETRPYLNYVRPDFLLIRVVAKNLIMWSTILPTDTWIDNQVPEFIIQDLENPKLSTLEKEVSKQAMYNIIGGACLSLGLRYAGSKNKDAFQCLLNRLDIFTKMLNMQLTNPQQHITKVAVRVCVGVMCTSAAMVMSGTGNQELLSRLQVLNERISEDMDYGNHMAVSMSLGVLFMGLGGYTLTTTNEAVAGLLCSFYPFYPTTTEDNQYHPQAFRHLWVLAADSRWLMPFDVDNKKPCRVPMQLEIYEDDGATAAQRKVRQVRIEAPTVVPDYKLIKSIQLDGDRYWPLNIQMGQGEYQDSIIKSGLIYVKRRKGCKSYEQDPFGKRI
ncbi:hypothetical protein INT48_001874 [Thamnidium elegans]|uniref:Anaphase-promoting complex subunit 1 n=1 Tax=Thamnidium elegans TaxID=101142 RepID=A0A8H7SR73_9FUNG|nr:hypothetical protein INT48_001874 [Thamnidium elegans]